MPDSPLPIQGLASQRERDLDALLSGEPGYPVVVSERVAAALAALRAAPAPDELDGEAAARAAFRLFLPPEAGEVGEAGGARVPAPLYEVPAPLYEVPAPLYEVPAPLHQGTVTGPAHSDGQSPTVVLRRTAPRRPRHARPRRVPWPGSWQAMTAACGAAAALIVCLVAIAGGFSGPAGQQGHTGQKQSAQATGTSSKRPASSVLITSTPHPISPTSAASPEALCRQYTSYFTHPDQPANGTAENAVIQQLSKLAGPAGINGYCAKHSGGAQSGADQDHWGGADRGGYGWFGRAGR